MRWDRSLGYVTFALFQLKIDVFVLIIAILVSGKRKGAGGFIRFYITLLTDCHATA